MKFLNPKVHGVIDYLAVAILFLAPALFGFEGTSAALLAYALGSVQLLLSLFTAYPMGLVRAIPFPIHGGIELAAGILMLISPWLFRFPEMIAARNFFVLSGVAIAAVWSTTNYQATLSHKSAETIPFTGDYEIPRPRHKKAA